MSSFGRAALALLAALLSGAAAPPPAAEPVGLREGLNLNSFTKQGPVAAHLLLRDGRDPRLLVAFPAGNSGVGLWFERLSADARWTLDGTPQPITVQDARGRPLHGIRFRATVRAPRLVVKQAVLSSVRVLRDYQGLGTAPAEVLTAPSSRGRTLIWARDRLDGAPGYRLALTVEQGRPEGTTISAGADGAIVLTVEALTGETPLTPFAPGELLTADAAADPAARAALDFLSFREKLNAGSWRFNTYFGRDTLMSVRLLMPALQPAAVEAGLRSVLERLAPNGDVAHEESLGEFAILDHRKKDGSSSAAPVFDYAMIDSSFMLAPVARAWLVDDARGRSRAAAFLGASQQGGTAGAALLRNIRYIASQAEPFARDPRWQNLVTLKPGIPVGEWRDSNDGLGGGRYPYDVNAVLLPAALDAAVALHDAGLLDRYAAPADKALFGRLGAMAQVWRTRAPALFAQSVAPAEATAAAARYAQTLGVPAPSAPAAPVRYNAIALDKDGRPVPIVHSDEGFGLLFEQPDPQALSVAAETIARPFPLGLMTGVGMLVANPVFAPPALQARFGPNAYHGTVIWSWHQALAAAGLARQIARSDLPPATCALLRDTQAKLWQAIEAGRVVRNSELWSWRYAGGRYEVAPFGASGGDADESNAAQLWSTVYLAVHKPGAATPGCKAR